MRGCFVSSRAAAGQDHQRARSHDTKRERKEAIIRRRTALLGIGGAIVLLTGGGTAYATIAGGPVSNAVVQGCYDSGGNLKVLMAGQTTCDKGYTALTWNQQGPAGATGLQGPTGATGPQGPVGATGAQGPPGTGLSSLDGLDGLPCNTSSPDAGVLKISYTPTADNTSYSTTFTCVTTTLYTLTVNLAARGVGTGTVTASAGDISCGTNCSAQYGTGAEVTLTETPDSDSGFAGWSGGGCSGTATTCTVTMSQAQTVTTTFTSWTLTVTVNGANGALQVGNSGSAPFCLSGSNSTQTCTFNFGDGTSVEMFPSSFGGVNNPPPSFTAWGGACAGVPTDQSCTVTMNQPQAVTVTFSDAT